MKTESFGASAPVLQLLISVRLRVKLIFIFLYVNLFTEISHKSFVDLCPLNPAALVHKLK